MQRHLQSFLLVLIITLLALLFSEIKSVRSPWDRLVPPDPLGNHSSGPTHEEVHSIEKNYSRTEYESGNTSIQTSSFMHWGSYWNSLLKSGELVPVNNSSQTGNGYLYMEGSFGQFANRFRALLNAAILAKFTNRILRVGPNAWKTEWKMYFNWDYLCRNGGFCIEFIDDISPYLDRVLVAKKGNKTYSEFITSLRDGEFSSHQDILLFSSSRVTALYFLCHPIENIIELYRALIPSETYIHVSSLVMEQVLKIRDGNFVAIHLRDLEGNCKKFSKKYFKGEFEENLVQSCNYNWSILEEVMRNYKIEFSDVFVASDGQRLDILDEFLGHNETHHISNLSTLELSPPLPEGISHPFLDAIIMIRSGFFLGTALSSFSTMIADYRVVHMNLNYNILHWPSPMNISTDSYWLCGKIFGCNRDGSVNKC